jgi:hypothetical protein
MLVPQAKQEPRDPACGLLEVLRSDNDDETAAIPPSEN